MASAKNMKSILALLMALCVGHTFAQGSATGALSGSVVDSTDAVIVGAKVELVGAATGETFRTETTNSAGLFTFTLIPAGSYNIQVSASGFATTMVRNIAVQVTETSRITVQLPIAKAAEEMVEVQAEGARINTTDATTGASVAGTTINELPLASRNFQQLLTLSAGASSDLNSASQLGRGEVHINVNGGREDNNNYQIEGVGVNDITTGELLNTPLPSTDAIAEFKMATSLYDATQGRNGGGNINAVLKSGTKDYHFDAFEYFRNTDLDANDFFINREGLQRPAMNQNIFGASLGGPVDPKRKLLGLFFFNYQGTRQKSGDTPGAIISTEIPYIPAVDRTSITQMAADCLPAGTTVDPVAFNILSVDSNQFGAPANGYLYPVPNAPAGTPCGTPVPFTVSIPGWFNNNQLTANWDRDFRAGKDRLSVRYFYSNALTYLPFAVGDGGQLVAASPDQLNFPFELPLRNRFGSLAETHIFTNSLVNEARIGLSVISYRYVNLPMYTKNTDQLITDESMGIARPTDNFTNTLYRFSFLGSGIEFGPTSGDVRDLSNSVSALDTLSYVHGAHSLRVGVDIEPAIIHRFLGANDNGQLFYAPTSNGLSDFQNFMMGAPPAFIYAWSGDMNHEYHVNNAGVFAQDDYRVTPSLTLNLGLRIDMMGAPYDSLCHTGNSNPSLLGQSGGDSFFYPACISKLGLSGISGSGSPTMTNDSYARVWEPRIGFAYDLLGKHKTSIRSGYGIYPVREDSTALDNMSLTAPAVAGAFAAVPGSTLANFLVGALPPVDPTPQQLQPFVPTPSYFLGFSTTPYCANGVPNTADTSQWACFSGDAIDFYTAELARHWVAPTTQQWNFDIQQSIGKGWSLDVSYVGTKGTHLREGYDADQATSSASPQQPITITAQGGTTYIITQNTYANMNARAPFLGIAPPSFQTYMSDSNSSYNALQVTGRHQLSRGLYLQSAYTFSKSIDESSTGSAVYTTRFNNQSSVKDSRSVSDFDHTHRFVTSYNYDLPFFAGQGVGAFTRHALGGWGVSGVVLVQSAAPFGVTDSLGGSAYGLSSPNLVTPTWMPGFNCSNAGTSGGILSRVNDGYINPAAFTANPVVPNSPDGSTGYGNVPRNCMRGPLQFNIDFSIGKVLTLGEHQNLKFSADFFNLTNTPSFANPFITDIENPQAFGRIASTMGTPRLVQFALRYAF